MRELMIWLFRPDGATVVFVASVAMIAVLLTMPLAPSGPLLEVSAPQPHLVPRLSAEPRVAWEGR